MDDFVTMKVDDNKVTEELAAADPPQPMLGRHDIAPPPFLTKTFDMVEDRHTNNLVSWSRARNSFIVWDCNRFSTTRLPRYFKHNNFSSFIRQLNTYGFRKVDPERFEFAQKQFLGGQRQLLKNINRRRNVGLSSTGTCVEIGLDTEVDKLRKERRMLMREILKLRQQQVNLQAHLTAMEKRIQNSELRHQQTMTLLARTLKESSFIKQLLVQAKVFNGSCKKRRLTANSSTGNLLLYKELGPGPETETLVSVMENDAGSSSIEPRNEEIVVESTQNGSKADNDVSWEELLNVGYGTIVEWGQRDLAEIEVPVEEAEPDWRVGREI